MISNRQSSRRRGRGGSQRSSGSSGQRDSGNRIDSRARGNAAQLLEKYKNMARDAQMQGDRVNTEYYLQFADHYFRVLSDGRSRSEDQRPQPQGVGFESDDEDYGMEGEPVRSGQPLGREDGNGGGAPRGVSRRDDDRAETRNGEYSQHGDRRDSQARDQQRRDQQGRDQQSRDTQSRSGQSGGYQGGQAREQGQRSPVMRADDDDQRNQPAQPNGRANGGDAEHGGARSEPAERKSTRSRRPANPAPVEAQPTLDADSLPPALGAGPAESGEAPKRRRGRPPASDATQAS